MILQTAELDGAGVQIGIEDSSNGTALIQDLRRDPRAGRFALWPVRARADKAVRAAVWAAQAQAGLVHLVSGPWVEPFLQEAALFPFGAHDDQVDAVSGAWEMLTGRRPVRVWV